MFIRTLAALGLLGAIVAGCSNDPTERALTGGALGAAGGAAVGELVADDPAVGALAGGAAGAAAGALTDEDDIDLGNNPYW
jgi:osmotically inducible lipoprotein OsmB